MMPDPLVLAESVSRWYGVGSAMRQAVSNAHCMVFPGDRIALVGPSGSGKSTLLHLLSGLDQPTGGTVSWPALGPAASLRPGLVTNIFQGPSLLPPFTVVQNVALPLILLGLGHGEAEARAVEALTLFGVERLHDKLPEEISGGQAQRVSIARAVVVRPKLILADEPTGQLDTATARIVLDVLLDQVIAGDSAIVLATHDPALAERCQSTWSMVDGILDVNHPAPAAAQPANLILDSALHRG
jgi:ABC-type lipoprotein export system ATPase subunit